MPLQVKKIVERAYRRAKDLLMTNEDILHKVGSRHPAQPVGAPAWLSMHA